MEKTIAQQLNVKDFPFIIEDKNVNEEANAIIYYENCNGFWYRRELDIYGYEIYYEDSNGFLG